METKSKPGKDNTKRKIFAHCRSTRDQTLTKGTQGGPVRKRYIKKGGQHLFQERREIFRFIKENREIFPVEKMCKVMKVSVSGYYYWLNHPVGSRMVKEQDLLVDINRIYDDSKKRGPDDAHARGRSMAVPGSLVN